MTQLKPYQTKEFSSYYFRFKISIGAKFVMLTNLSAQDAMEEPIGTMIPKKLIEDTYKHCQDVDLHWAAMFIRDAWTFRENLGKNQPANSLAADVVTRAERIHEVLRVPNYSFHCLLEQALFGFISTMPKEKLAHG